MHLIEQAFGENCSLYKDVLQCPETADAAQLRKAYYRSALKVHPDKNPGNAEAAQKFQALSLAYQILCDTDLRQEYDETGVIPHQDATAADDDNNKEGVDAWKSYFDQIFGKVTVSKINDFAAKYKCSDEEKRDVLKEFKKRKGNLVKMLDFVMLSEPRDALRWVTDYLQPAATTDAKVMANGLRENMEKSLIKIRKMIDKENAANKEEEEDDDDEETETESEDEDPDDEKKPSVPRFGRFQKSPSPKKPPAKKKRKASAESSSNRSSMDDLVAQIQNKRRGGNVLSTLGARYGVEMDEDPLKDADFEKLQSKYKKTKRK